MKHKPGRHTIATTPEIVDSVNALILVDRSVTTEDISEKRDFREHITQNWIWWPCLFKSQLSLGFTRTIRGLIRKNGRKYHLLWLGTAGTSSFKFSTSPLRFLLVRSPQIIFTRNKVFKQINEVSYEKKLILYSKNRKAFSWWETCYEEFRLYWKVKQDIFLV